MRTLTLAVAALLASGSAALAAPQSVTVSISPALQAKAHETYGERDIQILAQDLRTSVARELGKSGAYDGARIELTLVDAVPNRPTFKQLGDTPGLDMRSFGVGGANIVGRAVAPDGTVTPLAYKWYETDIRWARGNATWTDAEWTFDRFASQLGRGKAIAER
jgi:hypothetical protein